VAAATSALGCVAQENLPGAEGPQGGEEIGHQTSALSGTNLLGANLLGANLLGANLLGANLLGANLLGANLGGANLLGANLLGANMGGTNLGGNNLGGNYLSATTLGGVNLAGATLAGVNLAGQNLAGSALNGSSVAGAYPAGNSRPLALAGPNLAGSNTGRNIHDLTGSINGMLYSGEDLRPKTAQCVVMGLGSTAFAKLLGQQTPTAKMSVALGKLPWGFAASSGGPMALRAWEAIVWGDQTYCVFVLAAPNDATWPGVAGFLKAVFRWNAPPTQTMEVSGIEASAPHDPTLSTSIVSYTGMMNAAARLLTGTITDKVSLAGELAFVTATVNNQSVTVDFATWVQDKNKSPLVMGNVTSVNSPTYAEALYIALDNGDGTVQVIIDDAASRTSVMPGGMVNSVVDLDTAYRSWRDGLGPKPIPRRCNGALYLNTWYGEPVPAGKCESGLTWAPGFCIKGASPWSTVPGTVAPMNSYMQLTASGGLYQRAVMQGTECRPMKTVLSETYVHMWDKSYDIPAGACTPESNASFCARRAKNCGTVTGTDNCGSTRTVASCGVCASGQTCGADVPNVCVSPRSRIYEAEALGNTLSGAAYFQTCPRAYMKVLGEYDPALTPGTCSGGGKVKYLGNGSQNHLVINKVNVPSAGVYTLTVYATTSGPRTFLIGVNGGIGASLTMQGPDSVTPVVATRTVMLAAGDNTIKFYNNTAPAPDLDRIKISAP
jgi:hypothetical protein